MEAKVVWSYVNIGTGFRYLQDASADRSIHGKGRVLDNIDRFLNSLDSLDLRVTKIAAAKLIEFRNEIEKKAQNEKLSQEDVRALKRIMRDLRPTFRAEALCQKFFVVTSKRLDLECLLAEVAKLFAPNSFSRLSEIAQYDFSEAGKCIAFERPTAAAFHLMRGMEAVVFTYYKKFIRPAKKGQTWGQMTTALRQKTKGKKPKSDTLAHLDHIRSAFRNPTQHPEKIYTIDDAQDLFFLCIDATNRTVIEIMA